MTFNTLRDESLDVGKLLNVFLQATAADFPAGFALSYNDRLLVLGKNVDLFLEGVCTLALEQNLKRPALVQLRIPQLVEEHPEFVFEALVQDFLALYANFFRERPILRPPLSNSLFQLRFHDRSVVERSATPYRLTRSLRRIHD